MAMQRFDFPGSMGQKLAARLDLPEQRPRAYALFAHCFTCGKDIFAASRIAAALTSHGIAVLRFDFTGLGASEGEFENTNFSSNLDDLIAAADHLRDVHAAPSLLIGHSLGGAAVLAAAQRIPETSAIVTIGAPSDPAHVVHQFAVHVDRIQQDGEALVQLAGRPFRIRKQFLDDVAEHRLLTDVAMLGRALLVMHSPLDQTVEIGSASRIFASAKHSKSFVSLNDADHLLSRRRDAGYVADIIAAWSSRYIGDAAAEA
ncbi:alpha/beta fold hydrolase [Noviherbaspirillum sp. CPCC 100848]|uniref:Alpha/beta fold hydrolase n=1 Tax=Noviherbaspirillum album TaxID=3080276 RepID=A0ABU6JF82_9BURK|nr:alpha/beta fold hydrolase [Noviherbaspirillum sp. CPCC 100848]MEC4722332.1 alpha/beta fold hydrolase [Noviherbaspirillum sp. CPCC 100848]